MLDKFDSKYKYIVLIFGIIFLLAIILTGERSNGIKAVIGFLLLILFYKKINIKYKISVLVSFLVIISFFVLNSEFLKMRYTSQFKNFLNTDNVYFNLYKSGYQVFKNYPILGVVIKIIELKLVTKILNNIKTKKIMFAKLIPIKFI